jgi:predicted MFS family arabinose efflux permease
MAKICNSDVVALFISKILRMFSFGAISVVFFDALLKKGIQEMQIGLLQSLIAIGDIIISLILTTRADKIGRKRTLILSAILKIFAGVCYALSDNYVVLVISGALGVLTISGG